jgi:hypothetical protein
MIKTSKQLKDLIRNLSKKKSSGCPDADATLYDGTISGANFSF